MKIDKNGNKIVAGTSSRGHFEVDGNVVTNDSIGTTFFVLKLSPNNEVMWLKKGFSQDEEVLGWANIINNAQICLTKSDKIQVIFYSIDGGGYNVSDVFWEGTLHKYLDNLLLLLNEDGSTAWQKSWDGNTISLAYQGGIKTDKDDNVYILTNVMPLNAIPASPNSGSIYIDGQPIPVYAKYSDRNYSSSAMLLLKFDNLGNLLWYRTAIPKDGNRAPSLEVCSFDIDKRTDDIHILLQPKRFNTITFSHSSDTIRKEDSASLRLLSYKTDGTLYNIEQVSNTRWLDDYSVPPTIYAVNSNLYFNAQKESSSISSLSNNKDFIRKMNSLDQIEWTYYLDYGDESDFRLEVKDFLVDKSENIYLSVAIRNKEEDRRIELDGYAFDATKNTGYYFLMKMNNKGEMVWIKETKMPSKSYYLAKIETNHKGSIYIADTYKPNEVIGHHTLPNRPTTTGSYDKYWYVIRMIDESHYYTPPPVYLEGKTFIEKGNNCILDNQDIAFPTILIKSNSGRYAVSDNDGNYSMPISLGTYTIESSILKSNFFRYIKNTTPCESVKEIVVQDLENDYPYLNFGFKVKPCSYLNIDVTNERRRRCFLSSTTIEYQNQGFANAQNVEVKVEYPDYIFPVSSSPSWSRKEGNTYFFNVGSLAAGKRQKIVFQDSVICGIEEIRGLTQCVKATISPANSCEDWTDTENKYEISGRCVGGGMARYIIKNLTNTATDSIPYRLYANSKVFAERNTLLPANGEVEIEVFTNGATMRMELFPRNHDPISAFVEGCQVTIPYKTKAENPNPVVSVAPIQESGVALPQNDGGERSETSCSEILDSYDPNDKQVLPFGLTKDNLIEATTELDYTIRFQNTGTIEAVNIVVLDTLSEFLDIETIRLGMVSHDYNFIIDGDAETRVLRFEFDNINLPDSNTNEPASHGFIKFKIKQKANNSIGTVIKNKAAIYFDFNSPIITNTISNKVAVLPLRDNNLNLPIFNCSDANFELIANAGKDIETPNSTATLAAQNIGITGNWTLLSGFGEITDISKNNSKVTGLLPFPTELIWRVAACGEAKQDTVIVQSTNTDYKFTIDFNETESKLSVPTGKVTYQWYRDGILITGQTEATLNLETLQNRIGVYTVVISSGITSITSEPFTIDTVLSNNDFIKANYIKVYPNPTTSLLNVELNTILNASEVTLVNALGMELQKSVITNSNKITLDLENLSNGIYFVKIISQKGIFYKKVVLKK